MTDLYIPLGYHKLTPEAKKVICNGCGAKGGIDFPDSMWGQSMTVACDIHDYMWYASSSSYDVRLANEYFWYNMKVIVKQGSWWLRGLRYARAHKYYLAVKWFGTSDYIERRGFTK